MAPLKPVIERDEWDGEAAFPRLQKRGPIEARRSRSLESGCISCFHAYKSVAPLKLDRSLAIPDDAASFHAYKSVAPLKRGGDGDGVAGGGCFHAYKSVAPLKLAGVYGEWRRDAAFPRLQKRGHIEGAQSRCARAS